MWLSDHPRLRRILAAYAVNEIGRYFALIALSLIVLARTHSAVAVGAVMATPLLPALLAPVLIARLERSARRGTISALYLIEALAAAGIAGFLWHFSFPGILFLLALDGAVSYAARGLLRAQANINSTAGEEASEQEAHRANAALNVLLALTAIVGPALAGLAVGGLGGPIALLIDCGCMALAALLVADLNVQVQSASQSLRQSLAEARNHLRAEPILARLFAIETLAFVSFTMAAPLEVALVKHVLRAPDAGYGIFEAIWGVGLVAGSIIFARFGGAIGQAGASQSLEPSPNEHEVDSGSHTIARLMLPMGTFAVGAAFLGLAVAPSFRLACIAGLIGGLGNGIQWAAALGRIQRFTPQRLMARVMSLFEGAGAVAPIVGFMLGGLLASVIGVRSGLLFAGIAALVLFPAFIGIGSTHPRKRSTQFHFGGDPDHDGSPSPALAGQVNEPLAAKPLK